MELTNVINAPDGYCGIVKGRNIIKSAGVGNCKPEYVQTLGKNLKELVKSFNGKPFAYIADPSKMSPILSKEISEEFAKIHSEIAKLGCKAIAFLDGNTAAMKLQSQKHQNMSDAKEMQVLHFRNDEEALEWFSKMGI